MYGPLHEMELTPLINVTAFPQLYCTCSFGGDEEIGAIQLWEEVQKVLLTKYRIDFHYIPFLRGEDRLIIHFSWESQETILANEEKNSYYYLRKYPDYYRAQFFEGIYKPTPTGPVKYTNLAYKTTGKVIPYLGENKGNEEQATF